MEDWKIQTKVNAFLEACEGAPTQLVASARSLRRTLGVLRKPEQRQAVIEQLTPLLDGTSASVRQLAACIILDMPIEKFSSMPSQMAVRLYDDKGLVCFEYNWEDTVPKGKQQTEWMAFVADHMIDKAEKRDRFS